jgi:hypothetical protein
MIGSVVAIAAREDPRGAQPTMFKLWKWDLKPLCTVTVAMAPRVNLTQAVQLANIRVTKKRAY